MNSYMPEQEQIFSAEQMHNFLKDKQAWENAIALYQGTDPLDHWYNYVCWYENYGHGDPDNKFRETLERCLTIFEHHEYYRNDTRMVRLWLKYIDMQGNPLHFYQVLYQRGVGRQLAIFYIHWAAYYESIQSYKDAESIYNLGFQEKAQPYAELQHALVKLMYTRSALQQQQQQQEQLHHQQQQQQQQQQQHKSVIQQQVTYQNNNVHCQVHDMHVSTHAQLHQQQHHQQQQQQQQQETAATTNYTRNQLTYAHIQQQQQHIGVLDLETQQQQHYMQQHHMQQQQQQTHVNDYHTAQQLQQMQATSHHQHHHHNHQLQLQHQHHHNHNIQHAYHINAHLQQQQQQIQHIEHITHHQHMPTTDVYYTQSQGELANGVEQQQQQQHHQQQHINQTEEIHSPITDKHTEYEIIQQQIEEVLPNETETITKTTTNINNLQTENVQSTMIAGIKLNKRFVNYARNNHETWKPALCLEEPADSSRVCHYVKNQVYHINEGVEYSPEELRAIKYFTKKNIQENQLQEQQQETQEINAIAESESSDSSDHEDNYGFSEREDDIPEENIDEEENADEEENDDDNDEDYEYDDDDDDDEEEEDDDENEHKKHKPLQKQLEPSNVTTDEQIEASTIRLSNNKTIKIKFKKEQTIAGTDTSNGGNYSAYKIESIYQQEVN